MRGPLADFPLRAALAAAVLACLLLAGSARASSVNLRWTSCWGDGGPSNRSFACNTNTGADLLVGSFVSPAAVHGVVSQGFIVDVGFDGSTSVPAWWQFKNVGSCRQTALVVLATIPGSAVQCQDWANAPALGTFSNYLLAFGNVGSIRGTVTVPTDAAADLVAGQEYFSFQLSINHQKTVGAGACGGCTVGACISLRLIHLITTGLNNPALLIGSSVSDVPSDARALWQLTSPTAVCDLATPARNRTWGEVKALYR